MPRKPRLNVPGAVYHVMSRCLEHYSLFSDDDDRERFLSLLGLHIGQTKTLCYARVLMSNHYHLVLRLSDNELGALMKPLNMHYAYYHRKKYGRRGPLFMDRFKSIATQDQNYVQELVRYVHLNPVRACICKTLTELNTYPWSGHSALVGTGGKTRPFQETGSVLKRFGTTDIDSRKYYMKFMEEGLKKSDGDDQLVSLVQKSNKGIQSGRTATCWVIGDREFVIKALDSTQAARLRINRFEREGGTMDSIASELCKKFNVTVEELKKRHRGNTVSDARKALAFITDREYHAPHRIIAEYLNVGSTAISEMSRLGKRIVEK
jgi:REP element-mobilizing transposase RayT